MRAVGKVQYLLHILAADAGIEHLLLRVVDGFAVPVNHIAIAVLAVADIVDILRDAREAEIHGNGSLLTENSGIQPPRQRNDPRKVVFIQIADMRQRDDACVARVKGARVEGQAARRSPAEHTARLPSARQSMTASTSV